MDCENFGKYLDNYESLTEQEKSDMDEHAAKCEECRAELDFFLSMISTVKSLPKAELPSDFMDKLNARLDAEDKRVVSASGIIGHFHRYGMRYAAAAACLALVAVITANRSLLTGQMDTVPDGVIREETTVSDGSAQNGSQNNTAADENIGKPAAETNNAQPSAAPQTNDGGTVTANAVSQTSAPAPRRSSAANAPRTDTFVPASAPRTVSEPSETVGETVSIPVPDENTQTDAPAPVNEPADNGGEESANAAAYIRRSVSEENEPSENTTQRKSYSIALASIVGNDDAPETYDLRPEEVSESIKPSEIQANYSLADEGGIARGKYSKLNKDGIPIESATAIGSIKFRADDEERAMDVINRYTVDKENNIYTTDSANLRLILSRLSSEGIEYTNYTIAGNGEVKFQIEFN